VISEVFVYILTTTFYPLILLEMMISKSITGLEIGPFFDGPDRPDSGLKPYKRARPTQLGFNACPARPIGL
jgi:hypothetical protein